MAPAVPTSGQSVQKSGEPESENTLPGKGQSPTTADSFSADQTAAPTGRRSPAATP